MADTTLHPQGAPAPQSVIAAQTAMTEYQALRQLGFIRGFDFVVLTILVGICLFFASWAFFNRPTLTLSWIVFGAVTSVILLQLWAISLIFRCMHNVLLVRSEINLMPEEAARLVVAFHTGTAVQPRRK